MFFFKCRKIPINQVGRPTPVSLPEPTNLYHCQNRPGRPDTYLPVGCGLLIEYNSSNFQIPGTQNSSFECPIHKVPSLYSPDQKLCLLFFKLIKYFASRKMFSAGNSSQLSYQEHHTYKSSYQYYRGLKSGKSEIQGSSNGISLSIKEF